MSQPWDEHENTELDALSALWVDEHLGIDGASCPVAGPLLAELPSPFCDVCGHTLTSQGRPAAQVVPLEMADPARAQNVEQFDPPILCRYWAQLSITERIVDAWGRSALHVRIQPPTKTRVSLNGDGWPAGTPLTARKAWLGPSWSAAAAAADEVAMFGAAWSSWGKQQPPYGQRHPVVIRRWLLQQWRKHATDRELASATAETRGQNAEPDDDRYWQDHDGWNTSPQGTQAVMRCLHCEQPITANYDGPNTGWAHLPLGEPTCRPARTAAATDRA